MAESPLDLLRAVFPSVPISELERVLAASRQSVERATNALLARSDSDARPSKRQKSSGGGLDSWLGTKRAKDGAPAPAGAGEDRSGAGFFKAGTAAKPKKENESSASKSAFEVLAEGASSRASEVVAPAAALPPLNLSTPEEVSRATDGHCTLILDVLPRDLAARLFLRMVQDSLGGEDGKGAWEKNKWYLFDRQVESPHTTSFYVDGKEQDGTGSYDQSGFAEATQYWYNGEKRPAQFFNTEMDEAREVIGPLVRSVLAARPRHPLEYDGDWVPNVAAANCYRGAKEGVGWHSDVLTYLGPYPTIASLSLGVTRPFRLRAVVPTPPPGYTGPPPPPSRTLSITLPHGSLIIMHAGCQEKYKHSVPLIPTMDLFRLPKSISLPSSYPPSVLTQGYRERINMTFRFYRPDFAPLPTSPTASLPPPNYAGTPICRCGVPTTLRPDARGRAKNRLIGSGSKGEDGEDGEDDLLFFWTCNGGAQEKGRNCGWWELLDMKKEGRGKAWKGPR